MKLLLNGHYFVTRPRDVRYLSKARGPHNRN